MYEISMDEQDQLDQLGGTSDRIEQDTALEEDLLVARKQDASSCPQQVRELVSSVFVKVLWLAMVPNPSQAQAQAQGRSGSFLPPSATAAWYSAMTIFDLFFACGRPNMEEVPLVVYCIVNLVAKFDNADSPSLRHHDLGKWVNYWITYLANCIKKEGYSDVKTPPGQKEENRGEDEEQFSEIVFAVEKRILEALQWQLNVPTVESWLSVYYVRLMTVCPPECRNPVTAVWRYALMHAGFLMVQQAPRTALRPQVLARGLLANSLRQVFSLDSLAPNETEGMTNDERIGDMPQWMASATVQGGLLDRVLFALDEPVETIQKDAAAVSAVMSSSRGRWEQHMRQRQSNNAESWTQQAPRRDLHHV